MGKPLGSAGQTRLRVLQQAASLGLSLFPASTQIALWEYSDKMTGPAPYRVLVPMGPLPAQLGLITRRQQLQQITDTLTPRPGAPAALHSSIWAAFQWMTGHYQAGHVNAVVVFGSGTETARDDMPLHALLTALRAAYNPRRPIEIITVSAGSSGDTNGLRQITAISHGAAYTVAKPADIAHVFFDAVARRICNPDCPVG
jgi:hypothetical protein